VLKTTSENDLITICYNYNLSFKSSEKVFYIKTNSYQHSTHNNSESIKCREYYISKKDELTLLLKKEFQNNNHFEIGELLDYPSCCITFFKRYFALGQLNEMNFNHFINGETNSSFYLNNFLIENDIGLLSHFPCNTNCVESERIGLERFTFLEKEFPEIAKEFKKKLRCDIYLNKKKKHFKINDFNNPKKNYKLDNCQIINFK
jgi:hypothetical protein